MESKSKVAVVTGGSRGLGRDMALRLAEKGIHVVLTYHSRQDEADKVVAQIEQTGQKAAALQLDVANIKSFDSFFDQLKGVLENKFNADRFDFLVNNGGIGRNELIGSVRWFPLPPQAGVCMPRSGLCIKYNPDSVTARIAVGVTLFPE